MAIKQAVNDVLHRVGYEIRRSPYPREFDVDLINAIQRLGINTVIDVGAHDGEFGRSMRNIRYHGRIVSFEPQAESRSKITPDSNWSVLPYGLGDEEKTATINVYQSTDFTSLLQPTEFGIKFCGDAFAESKAESIEIRRLDQLWLEHIHDTNVLLKTDTQGFDLQVLDGCGEHLRDVSAIVIEVSLHPLYEGAPDFQQTMSFLKDRGYYLSNITPIWRGDEFRVVEMDALFLREPRLATEPPVPA